MKQFRFPATAAAFLAPFAVGAGGIDQSGQPVIPIFEEGRRIEAVWGLWTPQINGTGPGGRGSGNVYGPLNGAGASFRLDLSPRWAAALILDQPYGIVVNYDLDYAESGFPYAGTSAEPRSLGVTGLVRYKLGHGFSLHGGLRATRFGTDVHLDGPAFGPIAGYDWETGDDWGLGYVVGAAWELPAIAMRVALTYGSATEIDLNGTETIGGMPLATTTRLTMPQSVNLDLQTGIAADTLLYGSVRWADWGGWTAAPPGLAAATGKPLVTFAHDSLTFRLGLGRQFTDRWSAAAEISHETGTGETQIAFTPYDGFTALGIGAAYAMPSGVEIAGGASWYALGDADVYTPAGLGRFRDNHALGIGLKLSYTF